MIWEISTLEDNHSRLVPFNPITKRVICIRNLACSPHFRATLESRQVAMHLYPIRLPVSTVVQPGKGLAFHIVDDDEETDMSKYSCHGAIYINIDCDIFVFFLSTLANSCLVSHSFQPSPLGGPQNFGWRSPSLSRSHYENMRHIMLFDSVWEHYVTRGCFRSAYW
ncbi:hypothetical protein F5Y10DRAFT_258684 [Nemania abortiva]|nr:hypothetical protein F5Y10DRAFT_258684 [Nemania abortiva]